MGSGLGGNAQPGRWGEEQPSVPPDMGMPHGRAVVRRLSERDRDELGALLAREPGFSLFLAGNLASFSVDASFVRYFGLFAGPRLRAALMLVGHRATIYAPPGTEIAPLVRHAAAEGFDFAMGRTDLVDALVAQYPASHVTRREEHYLAGLTRTRAPGLAAPPPPGVRIRRAGQDDLDELTRLYYGSDGFEELTADEVRRAMSTRVRGSLRTWVAEAAGAGRLLAGASTSAEAPGAAMIGGVWTMQTERNRGLSTAVVAALSRELLAEGRRPYLFYLMHNAPAARVYAKCGFTVAGRWTVAYLRHGTQA